MYFLHLVFERIVQALYMLNKVKNIYTQILQLTILNLL